MRLSLPGRGRLAALAAALLILIPYVSAYVPMRCGSAGYRLSWPAAEFPITLSVNDSTARGTPNLAAGGDALSAIKAAMLAWQSIQTASIRFSQLQVSPLLSGGEDGTNLITMADTPANRPLIGDAAGPVALTRVVYSVSTGK